MKGQIRRIRSSFALDIEGKEITIRAAASGRRGYYCPGCKRMTEAVKPLQKKPRPYFRHVATDVLMDAQPCTYSDESYRHKIAKEILARIKSIRLPKVPKYPPKGFDGPTRQVAPARTIYAHTVQIERDFYEDENHNLHWGRFEGIEKNALIRPDVIFFNEKGVPVLFIELVATHKPDYQKLEKIKRLGVDTVTVKVPLESSEAIEECFYNTYNIKWFFNNEQERADYFQLPGSSAERISDVDNVQRRLFEETPLCRKNRIRNLVRAFSACILTEHYSQIEGGIRNEISELDKQQAQRRELERGIDKEVFSRFDERRNQVKQREAGIERIRRFFKRKESSLEDDIYNQFATEGGNLSREEGRLNRLHLFAKNRYERKRIELEQEEERLSVRIGLRSADDGSAERHNLEVEEYLTREIEQIEESIGNTEREIRRIQVQMESIPESFERKRAELVQRYSNEGKAMERQYRNLERKERLSIEELDSQERDVERGAGSAREELIRRFKKLEISTLDSIAIRDISTDSTLSREIKGVVSTGKRLSDYQSVLGTYEGYEQALRYLNSEAFKDWIKIRRTS